LEEAMRVSKNKKFDYSPKKYISNPLFRGKKKRKGSPVTSLRSRIVMYLILVLMLGLVSGASWLFLFSDFFKIKSINISATGNVGAEEVRAKAIEQMNGKTYKVINNNNIIIFNSMKLADSLNQYYNFEYLKVGKSYPSKLNITFKTRQQAFVWSESGVLYYIDNIGNMINETNPVDQNFKKFSLIENQSMQKLTEKQLDNIADILSFISELKRLISDKKISNIIIEKFILDNNLHAVKLKAVNGPEILFNVNGDIGSQIDKLNTLMKEKLRGDFNKKKYIDIRFGDMIYYQ
jgi:cell division septal protein FtsQ